MTTNTLYFAHANGFPAPAYRKLLDALSDRYRIEALDMAGHHPDYPVDDNWQNLVQELIADLEAKASAPVVGVGHSLGGVLILLAVIERPELFKAFVMLDPPIMMGSAAVLIGLAKRSRLIDRLTPAGKTQYRRRHWPDAATAVATLRDKPLFRDFDPDCLHDYVHYGTTPAQQGVRLRFDPRTETAIFRAIPHNLPRLPRISGVPGALLYASPGVARPRDIRKLAKRHSLLLRQSPGGHMFPLERPLATAELIAGVIQELLPSSEASSAGPEHQR